MKQTFPEGRIIQVRRRFSYLARDVVILTSELILILWASSEGYLHSSEWIYVYSSDT